MSSDKAGVRRLGRGLSSLIQAPVQVAPPSEPDATDAAPAPKAAPAPDRLYELVEVASVVPSRFQPRRRFDDASLQSLSDSIRRAGVMQPIIVRPIRSAGSGAAYELVAGERRWRAATLAGLRAVPALVRELDDVDAAEWGLVENVQREDLNPMDRAWALRNLMEQFGLSHADLAERVGLDRSTVANLIRLTEIEREIAELVVSGKLDGGHARALLQAEAGAGRIEMAKKAAEEGWTVRQLEAAARRSAMESKSKPASPKEAELHKRRAVLADLERRLGQHLGTRVTIRADRSGQKGTLMLEFYGLDHFDGLLQRLGLPAEGWNS
jgi:ParB family chromosome partitioning protein